MLPIPQIQIQQQYGRIGIEADRGTQDIQQPRATLEMQTVKAQVDMRQPRGELMIDQSKAWAALGVGGNLEAMLRIYSQSKQVAINGVGRIAEQGDRLAAIHTGANAIADIGEEEAYRFHELDFYGEASVLNVTTDYIAHKPEVNVTDGRVNVTTHPNPPEINYYRGKLNIYMLQWPSIEITPPQIDTKV